VPSQCGHGWVVAAGVTGNDSRAREQVRERGGAPSLGDFCQLTWSIVDGVFKLIAAGFTRPGSYVGRVLKGVKPTELPVVQESKFELVINLKTIPSG
jgi:hypothetical protein